MMTGTKMSVATAQDHPSERAVVLVAAFVKFIEVPATLIAIRRRHVEKEPHAGTTARAKTRFHFGNLTRTCL